MAIYLINKVSNPQPHTAYSSQALYCALAWGELEYSCREGEGKILQLAKFSKGLHFFLLGVVEVKLSPTFAIKDLLKKCWRQDQWGNGKHSLCNKPHCELQVQSPHSDG